jgi:hypothetical protein
MGGDGGSIPTRGELVKLKTTSTTTKNENSLQKWRFCALSDEILRHPVVLDPRGRMMMKEVLVQFLLDGRGEEVGFGFKDVVELKLTGGDQFICPVTKKEMNGKTRFVAIVSCGHVFAESVLKEIPEKKCLECGKAFVEDDVWVINPTTEEDLKRVDERLSKVPKKKKRGEKRKADDTNQSVSKKTEKSISKDINMKLPNLDALSSEPQSEVLASIFKKSSGQSGQ